MLPNLLISCVFSQSMSRKIATTPSSPAMPTVSASRQSSDGNGQSIVGSTALLAKENRIWKSKIVWELFFNSIKQGIRVTTVLICCIAVVAIAYDTRLFLYFFIIGIYVCYATQSYAAAETCTLHASAAPKSESCFLLVY